MNHPNMVAIYKIGSSDEISYIAMELAEGETLRTILLTWSCPDNETVADRDFRVTL